MVDNHECGDQIGESSDENDNDPEYDPNNEKDILHFMSLNPTPENQKAQKLKETLADYRFTSQKTSYRTIIMSTALE